MSLDGAGLERIVVDGLGSRRFRVTARGPGGHSWIDWGTPNPIHVLATVAQKLTTLELSQEPRSTLTIARWGGGKSINAIPQEAWFEVDTRSSLNSDLASIESRLRSIVSDSATAVTGLRIEATVIGERPGGATDRKAPIVLAAMAATRNQNKAPILSASSTDANIPMSQGIPAITIGCGGEAGKAHTTGEWYKNVHGPEGIMRASYVVLLAAGLE